VTAHALLSPSAAHRWMRCPASVALEQRCPDASSEYADEGTAAHELAAMALTENRDADGYIGRVITVGEREFTVDEDMAAYVQVYLDEVRTLADGGDLFVEQRVDFSSAVGVEDSFGTSDAVIVKGSELILVDLKYGRGVQVSATENEQMLLYAIGGLDAFGLAAVFETVRLVIVQPRLQWTSDWSCPVDDVGAFAAKAADAAKVAIDILREEGREIVGAPGEKQCRFCKAKAICPALEREVQQAVLGDFSDLTAKAVAEATDKLPYVYSQALGRRMDAVELVEIWCKAVRARAESELLAGRRVDGWKLVEGRRGNREWRDPNAVEEALKGMRLKADDIYDRKLISPARAEKLLKDSPRRWSAISAHITQSEGKPSVAPMSDKRPAYSVADDFEDLTAPAASGPEQHPFRQ
jgi:hypothetical protein